MTFHHFNFDDLEQPSETLTNEAERNAQRFYQSCMEVNETRKSLDKQLLVELLEKIGGFPAIGNFTSEGWDFQKAMQTAHNVINTEGFFEWRDTIRIFAAPPSIAITVKKDLAYLIYLLLCAFIGVGFLVISNNIFIIFY